MNELDTDKMQDFADALNELAKAMKKAVETLQKFCGVTDEAEGQALAIQPPIIRKKQIPPRSTVSRARSPAVRRWWINYKARDKLPRNSLESGGKRKCQRKRSAYRMLCLL